MSVLVVTILIILGLIGLILYSRWNDELNKCPRCNYQMHSEDIGLDVFQESHNGELKQIVEKKCPNCNFIYYNRNEITPP